MEELKEIIAERIAQAREERNLTQKQVANVLGYKSSNAISEIERAKVGISAVDLYILAEYLNKPLLYFYGIDYKNKDTEDMIALIEKLPDEDIEQLKGLIVSQGEFRELTAVLQKNPNLGDDPETREKLLETINAFLLPQIKQLEKAIQIRDMVEEELGIRKK